MFKIRWFSSVGTIMLLSACGGGGGSGGGVNPTPPPPPPVQFSNFAAVPVNTSTTVDGLTREGTVSIQPTGAVIPSGVSNPSEASGNVTFSLNSSRQLTSIAINGAQSSVTFNSQNASAQTLLVNSQPVAVALSTTSGTDQALFADPYVLGFNYQTFGVWGSGLAAGSTGRYGAISAGSRTAVSAVPSSGTATFRGYAAGIYTDGAIWRYAANANFDVNFANRSVALTTTGATLWSLASGAQVTPGYLNISGTMNYAAGSSVFSGNLTAAGQTSFLNLTGAGSGTFFGPNANELGGTFFLRGTTGTLTGAFGAKR